jgi:3-oxoacyl-[acyl-carrier protein] reductase
VVSPGFIISPMTNKLNDNQKNVILEKIPMKRFGEANEIADLVYFLSSDGSKYITGQNIHINGGMLMV